MFEPHLGLCSFYVNGDKCAQFKKKKKHFFKCSVVVGSL